MKKSQQFYRGQRTQVGQHDAQNRLQPLLVHSYNVKCAKITCKFGKINENKKIPLQQQQQHNKKIVYEAAKIATIKRQKLCKLLVEV